MIDEAIAQLATYGLRTGLIEESEYIWAVNNILDVLKRDSYTEPHKTWGDIDLPRVLEELTQDALDRGLIQQDSVVCRDLFDTELMGRLTPRPAQVIARFRRM